MRLRTLTVKELSAYIGQSINLDQILKNIYVEGEISNFKIHSTGNVYFSLKDDRSKINCIMFERNIDVNLKLEEFSDGDKVICQGNVNYYDKEGYINLIIHNIQRIGEGQAYQEFLRLKAQLMEEGLFDEKYKKTLPAFPKRIGLVTSPTGAVIQDIYHVIKRRYPKIEILVYPSRVQGAGAENEVMEGIDYLQNQEVDTIIIARGGGSYEELSAFNSQELAYTIFNSKVPIVSAIGHETDFTIADLVADMRASTPSVAAELSVPRLDDILDNLDYRKDMLKRLIDSKLIGAEGRIHRIQHILESRSPDRMIFAHENRIKASRDILNLTISKVLAGKKSLLDKKVNSIFLKNPDTVFDMGGVYLTSESGHKIRSISEVEEKMKINISLKDGKLLVGVLEKL